MEGYYGVDVTPLIIGSFALEPRVELFSTVSAAQQREKELIDSGVPITFIDVHPPAKPGTHFLVRGREWIDHAVRGGISRRNGEDRWDTQGNHNNEALLPCDRLRRSIWPIKRGCRRAS